MGRSGISTILLLVLTIIIVMLAVSGTTGGISGLWDRIVGSEQTEDVPPTDVTTPRNMSSSDGMRQVEQAEKDMATMDSLARSIR